MKVRSVFLSTVCVAAGVLMPAGILNGAAAVHVSAEGVQTEQTGSSGAEDAGAGQAAFAGVFQAETQTEASGDFVKFEYPVLRGIDGFDQDIVDGINRHFREEAASTVQTEAANLEEIRQEMLEFNSEAANSLAYEVTCDSVYLDGGIFSVMQFHYTYSGGAHGYSFPIGTSFDLRTGEELSMGDLLGCDEATAQEAVVEAYREHIIGQVENITEESIRDSFDLMEYWKTAEGMYVNISPYNIASYAAGQQQALVTPEILSRVSGGKGAGEGSVSSDDSTDGQTAAASGGSITVTGGIQAPASDFIFPHSSTALLTDADLAKLQAETVEERHYRSQLAINEILARYGYVFSEAQGGAAKEAYDQFEGKDWYEQAKQYCPSTSANEMLYTYISATELENVEIICEWQKENGCYY